MYLSSRFGLLTCGMACIAAAAGHALADEPSSQSADGSITIAMRRCDVAREEFDATRLLLGGTRRVVYSRTGDVTVDGNRFSIYLPKAKFYEVENTGKDDSHHENKSTRMFIDADGDGKLADREAWFANLPVRLGDRMFDVVRIADKGDSMVLRPSQAPLRGLILGRKCPDFSYTTADGQRVTRDDYRGRAFLLDIWSVT